MKNKYIVIIAIIGLIIIDIIIINKKTIKIPTSNIDTYKLNSQITWNPRITTNAEWISKYKPRYIITGMHNDIYISDVGNSTIVRINIQNKQFKIIGKQGKNKGDYYEPREMAIHKESATLWIIDRQLSRISRYKIDSINEEFSDSFNIPGYFSGGGDGIIIRDEHTFWTCPGESDNLVYLYKDDKNIINAFGNLWIPNSNNKENIPISWIYNEIYLRRINEHVLAIIWMTRPYIELWDVNGDKLLSEELLLPEFEIMKSRKYPQNAMPTFVSGTDIDINKQAIYIMCPYMKNIIVIYNISSQTLKPIGRFFCTFEKDRYCSNLIVGTKNDQTIFYALDYLSGELIEMNIFQKVYTSAMK